MRKNFYLTVLFLCMVGLCISSCGSGGGSTADPMGTATIRFVDELGTIVPSTTCGVNGTITLRVFVSNQRSDGAVVPVVNEKVSFVVVNPDNGGKLVASSDRTGSDGEATALFTSGNSTYSDQVRATTSTGATAVIYINKTGGLLSPGIKSITTTNKEVVAGQTSVVKVNVVDGNGNPVMNVPVLFTIPVNGSNALFSNNAVNCSTFTDVTGNATVVYKAGASNPTADVYDSVQATLVNGSSDAVEIKRIAGKPSDLSVTLAATPTSVAAGQTSIITATVTGGQPAGAAVTFTIPVNVSGAKFINSGGFEVSTITAKVGSSGTAMVIYRAGSALPSTQVQDTIQALLDNGTNAAIILTRTSTVPLVYTVAISASSSSVEAGQVSIITATVTSNSGTTSQPAADVTVTFTLPVNSSGASLSPANAITDASGKAVAIYRPGSSTTTVQDTVQAAVGKAVNALVITVKGSSLSAFSISIDASPSTLLSSTSNSIITANVKNNAGTAVSGITVNFVATTGSLSLTSATTDGSGNAVVTYRGDGTPTAHTAVVTALITVGLNTYRAAAVIAYPAETTGEPTETGITVAANPVTVTYGQMSVITATVTGDNKAGVVVTFLLPINNSGATLTPATAVTDGSGKAVVIYQPGNSNASETVQDTVRAVVGTAAAAVVITRNVATSATTVSVAAAPASVPAGQVSIITATVTSISGSTSTPAPGIPVTFTLPVNNSGATLTPATATTDGTGKAVVIYQPGALSPSLTVQDTVQATVGSATAAVVLTRTVSAAATTTVSITSSNASLTSGQVSIITATATNISGSTSTPAAGVTVAFSLPVNSSGASLSAPTATTNSSGMAFVVYQPGTTNPDKDVQDVVQATYNMVTSSTVITRTAATTLGYSIDVEAAPTTLGPSESSVITANVRKIAGSQPVSGVTVTFTVTGANNATGTGMTDGSGNAVWVFTNGAAVTTGQSIVTASMTYGADTYTDAAIINHSGGGGVTPLSIAVSASPNSLKVGEVSIITATLSGDNKVGQSVTFSLPAGFNNSGATLSALSATTDGAGKAIVIYQPGTLNPSLTVQDTVQAAFGTATAAAVITRQASPVTTTTVEVAASPATLTTGQVSIVAATVTTSAGSAAGLTVNFTLPTNSSGASLSAATATTDSNGKAIVVYTPGTTDDDRDVQDVVQATCNSVTGAVVITRTALTTLAYSIDIAAGSGFGSSPTTLAPSASGVLTATVRKLVDSTPVSGVTVTFTVTGANSGTGTALTDGAGHAVWVFTNGAAAGQLIVQVSITFGPDTYTDALIVN